MEAKKQGARDIVGRGFRGPPRMDGQERPGLRSEEGGARLFLLPGASRRRRRDERLRDRPRGRGVGPACKGERQPLVLGERSAKDTQGGAERAEGRRLRLAGRPSWRGADRQSGPNRARGRVRSLDGVPMAEEISIRDGRGRALTRPSPRRSGRASFRTVLSQAFGLRNRPNTELLPSSHEQPGS